MRHVFSASAVLVVVALGCSSSTTGTGPGSSGTGNPDGGGTTPTCTASTTDGASACPQSAETCKGGQYCSVNHCAPGCLSTANCGNGLNCDLSAATQDPFVRMPVGVCRACSVNPPPPGACGDVHGAYTITNDASSSAKCPKATGECAVTQTGCQVTLTCPGQANTITIDAANKGSYSGMITFQGMTVNETCAVSFAGSSLVIDCQFTATGGAADCKIDGTKK